MKGQHRQLTLFFLPRDRSIYVEPFRIACEKAIKTGQFTSWNSLARSCGYIRKSKYGDGTTGDSTKLKTILGVKKPSPSQNHRKQIMIQRKTALRIIDGLGLDPVDFDL